MVRDGPAHHQIHTLIAAKSLTGSIRLRVVSRFGPTSVRSVIMQVDERIAGAWAQLAESARGHGHQPLPELAVGDVGDGESDAARSVRALDEGQSI